MRKVYVVFDAPPGHEGGRFVEVEDEHGVGVGGLEWEEEADGKWRLGPFLVGPPGFPTGLVDHDKLFAGSD